MTTPIPIFAIPILNRGDLLLRLVKSLDYPIEKLLIVNQGNDPSVLAAMEEITYGDYPFIPYVVHISPGRNIGVAGAWNAIIQNNLHLPYWIICANDMCFEPGSLKQMALFAELNHKQNALIYADGYSCFCMTQKGVREVGYFDENIYPAYLEDSDHFYRVNITGAQKCGFPNVKLVHGEAPNWGSSTIYSNEHYRRANGTTHGMNFDYYVAKWGGKPGEEKFTTPFGDPEQSQGFWKLDHERRKTQEQLWAS